MLDLVTVVFEKEVSMLALQASSIARFGSDIGRIVIINNACNDAGIELLRHRIQDEVVPCYGALADRVMLYDVKQLLGRTYGVQGWESQQILKLNSGRLCTPGSIAMLLDAKNYFAKQFDLDTFTDGSKLKMRIGGVEDWSREQYENSCRVWGLSSDQIRECAAGFPGIRTPWLIHSDVLISCADSYAELQGAFDTDPVTQFEFYIMGAFIHREFDGIQNYFMHTDETVAYHTHRSEWAALSELHRAELLRYMIDHNLFDEDGALDCIRRIQQDINSHP